MNGIITGRGLASGSPADPRPDGTTFARQLPATAADLGTGAALTKPAHAPAPLRLSYFLLREPESLNVAEQAIVQQLQAVSREVGTAYALVQEFLQKVRQRTAAPPEAWLNKMRTSGVEALQSFAARLERDKDAVVAGLSEPWSNGPVEGHVNKLKLLKRAMYGRAKFDLLRQRVLAPA